MPPRKSIDSNIAPTSKTRRNLLLTSVGLAAAGAGIFKLSQTDVTLAPGRSRARPVPATDSLPRSVDVVIIGGGFVGTAAALTLAERGVRVALCEKGVIAGEASGRSMGFVDCQMLDPDKIPLVARSKILWRGLNARTGLETGYRSTGLLAALGDASYEAAAEDWISATQRMPGAEAQILRGQALEALLPGMVDPMPAALYTPTDASVEPTLAAPAMAEAARRMGATILQTCAVRGLETSAGRVSGVVTEKGAIACQSVILAGGAWSSVFARSVGVSLPQFEIYMSAMAVSSVDGPRTPLSADGYGFRPQIDGGYSLGVVDFAVPVLPDLFRNAFRVLPSVKSFWPVSHVGFSPSGFWERLSMPTKWAMNEASPFEQRRILMPHFRPQPLEQARGMLHQHFPAFKSAKVTDRWAGVISNTLDNMPVISPVAAVPGLFIGSGFSYGLTMGPAAGEALADLATGRSPAFDLRQFRLERFSDGSEVRYRA